MPLMPRNFRATTGYDVKTALVQNQPHGSFTVVSLDSTTIAISSTTTAVNVAGSGFFDGFVLYIDTAEDDEAGDNNCVVNLKIDGNNVINGTIYSEAYYPFAQQTSVEMMGLPVCIKYDDANKKWGMMYVPITPVPFSASLTLTIQNVDATHTFRVGRLRFYYRTE